MLRISGNDKCFCDVVRTNTCLDTVSVGTSDRQEGIHSELILEQCLAFGVDIVHQLCRCYELFNYQTSNKKLLESSVLVNPNIFLKIKKSNDGKKDD